MAARLNSFPRKLLALESPCQPHFESIFFILIGFCLFFYGFFLSSKVFLFPLHLWPLLLSLCLIRLSILIVNVHLSVDNLDGTNYDTWTLDIKLWLKS